MCPGCGQPLIDSLDSDYAPGQGPDAPGRWVPSQWHCHACTAIAREMRASAAVDAEHDDAAYGAGRKFGVELVRRANSAAPQQN